MKAPEKSYRKGMSLVDVIKLFTTDRAAEKWLIKPRWPEGISCPHCGSKRIHHNSKNKTMPMRCNQERRETDVDVLCLSRITLLLFGPGSRGFQKIIHKSHQFMNGRRASSNQSGSNKYVSKVKKCHLKCRPATIHELKNGTEQTYT